MVQAAQDIAQIRSPSPATHIKHSRSRSRPSNHVEEPTASSQESVTRVGSCIDDHNPPTDETMPLLASDSSSAASVPHSLHKASPAGGHGHAHGSMNMRALVLHVLGDALGNVGVIATGLVIWKTTWSFKFYFDPVISLVITMIIFSSALPLGMFAFLPLSRFFHPPYLPCYSSP